jgi:hypothetical protein
MDFKKSILPHLYAIGIFFILTAIYFLPLFQGKVIEQHDINMHKGMSKEIADYRVKNNGAEPLWTNSMFSGMPAYQISVIYASNLVNHIQNVMMKVIPHPATAIFLLMTGFYLLFITLGINNWIAIACALGGSFISYHFGSLAAGHNSKAYAIAYMAPTIAGILMAYRGKLLVGGALTALALSLQIASNHVQITYYLMLIILILGISQLIFAIKEGKIVDFSKATGILLISAILAIGPNITNLLLTYEYGKYTIRGKSELTEKAAQSDGLDKDYALQYSYGKLESLTFLVPNFMGGGSVSSLDRKSETYKVLRNNGADADSFIRQVPLYWGNQPFVASPVYIGAIICFLFVIGMFIVDNRLKWWLFAATVLAIMLAWGRNLMWFTDFFFYYFPFYNKFRAVSMTLVIIQITMPIMAALALNEFLLKSKNDATIKKGLMYSFYIVGGLLAVFMLIPGVLFDFAGDVDEQLAQYPGWLMEAIRADRKSLLQADALRSMFFVASTFGLLWVYALGKINNVIIYISMIGLLLADGWIVDKRYLNSDNFKRKPAENRAIEPTEADLYILQDKDPNYRVFNLSVSPFNDASTSYFHKSIGGYHGAKLKRYQELIENQISKNNQSVLNMLNTRYYIFDDKKTGRKIPQRNPDALGNAWFVNTIKMVENADEEIKALDEFNPKMECFIDKRFEENVKGLTINPDSAASIILTLYEPNKLVYESNTSSEQLAVFSEIYYEKGWNAYIDGNLTPHFRTNYVLRAMRIPAGKHTIEYRFEPALYATGEQIALISSILLFLFVGVALFIEFKPKA